MIYIMNDLISVIVPVYNAEKYLDRCIKSIISQTYQNFELILIDDGSTDNSLDICKGFASDKITVIHKKNEGVSLARNKGIELSKGQFIVFCDSDDNISEDYLQTLYSCSANNPSLLPVSSINYIYENSDIIIRKSQEDTLKAEEFHLLYQSGLFNSPCNKMYQSKIIKENGILFNTNISVGEDAIFNLDYIKYIKGFFIIKKPLYNYYIKNQYSLDSTYDKERFIAIRTMYNKFMSIIHYFNSSKEAIYLIQKYIIDEYSKAITLYIIKSPDGFWQKLKTIKELFSTTAYNSCIKKIDDIAISHGLKLLMKLKDPLLMLIYLSIKK